MKNRFRLSLFILLGIIFSQCSKEQNTEQPTENAESPVFIFGQLSDNIIVVNDSGGNYLWQAINYQDSILLDVDADGVYDLNLKSNYYYSNGGMS
ncbi:MAG: hypothetical protein DA405_10805, partial [Bacteroidetes bacterium]